jgi:sugar/nucleoside kinase (ribokinase family)
MCILVVGNAAHLDLLLRSDARPGNSGFGLLSATPGRDGEWSEGGASMTIALSIVRAGGRAALWHALPSRGEGFGIEMLAAEGVDLGACETYDGGPVRSVMVYGDGWRLGWSAPPVAAAFRPERLVGKAVAELIVAPVWGAWTEAALAWAGASGIPASLVGFSDRRALRHDWQRVIVDREQARELDGLRAAEWVVTDGARGASVASGGVTRQFPAAPAEVVDTTGAGDTFAGSYIGALAAGLDRDAAARLAAQRAARVCETWGSRPARAFFEHRETGMVR